MARGTIKPHSKTVDGKKFTLYGDSDTLAGFIDGLTVDTVGAESYSNTNVEAHTVKRYPGDPGYSRAAHSRSVSDTGLTGGTTTTPGSRVWFERSIGTPPLVTKTIRQATYTGSWRALKTYAKANTTFPYTLRRESGRSVEISPPVIP